jgi:hypothetical protein
VTQTAQKTKKLGGDSQTQRQQGDLISLLKKIRGEGTQLRRDSRIHRQQGDLISLLLFFKNKESRLKTVKMNGYVDFSETRINYLVHTVMFIMFWNSYYLTVSSCLRSWCTLIFAHYYFTVCHSTSSSCTLHWTHLRFTICTIPCPSTLTLTELKTALPLPYNHSFMHVILWECLSHNANGAGWLLFLKEQEWGRRTGIIRVSRMRGVRWPSHASASTLVVQSHDNTRRCIKRCIQFSWFIAEKDILHSEYQSRHFYIHVICLLKVSVGCH